MGKWFGTDGIRGKANVYPMDAPTALAVGMALGRFFKTGQQDDHILIAQDTRISGDMLAMAVGAGICSAGVNVVLTGVLPTPGLARLAAEGDAVAGVVISASHNPYEDNGIKVFDGNGYKLSEADEDRIEDYIREALNSTGHEAGQPSYQLGTEAIGRMCFFNQANERYIDFLKNAVPGLNLTGLNLNGLTLVLDCANGATSETAPLLFERLGAEVVALFSEPDGTNINVHCGSQHPESLANAVVANKADAGLAFDGDGDRLIAVDERGRVLSGDQIMAICANDLMQKGKLADKCVVSTVMSNLGFHQALNNMGIQTVATAVGDRFVMERMRAEGAVLGGEDSGHIIFHDVHTTGDGILAALRLIDAMQSSGQRLSQLAQIMTVFPQALINVKVREKPPLKAIPGIKAVIEQVETTLGDSGRVLVRYSGTENKCRIMVEGPSKAETEAYCRQIADVVADVLGLIDVQDE